MQSLPKVDPRNNNPVLKNRNARESQSPLHAHVEHEWRRRLGTGGAGSAANPLCQFITIIEKIKSALNLILDTQGGAASRKTILKKITHHEMLFLLLRITFFVRNLC